MFSYTIGSISSMMSSFACTLNVCDRERRVPASLCKMSGIETTETPSQWQTHRQDRLQSTAPLCLARSVITKTEIYLTENWQLTSNCYRPNRETGSVESAVDWMWRAQRTWFTAVNDDKRQFCLTKWMCSQEVPPFMTKFVRCLHQ